jgi:hypothetical protein
MKKLNFLIILFVLLAGLSVVKTVHADAVTDAVNYLKAKQDATGQITGGSFGDSSPWAAIAFSVAGKDVSQIATQSGQTLQDYLLNNHPTLSSPATDWEKWILAITAAGFNPYDFGGINYVGTLESSTYYNSNQIGATGSVNDDWFGVLTLISSGVSSSDPVLIHSLDFILNHQNSDGGYGYSITAGSDGDDTAAAIQGLIAAENYGVSVFDIDPNVDLDNVIKKAEAYLLSTQDKTNGGFLADTNPLTTGPDSDSTTWALMALNVLGSQVSAQVNAARAWLLLRQSQSDGGFTACDQWDSTYTSCVHYGSNSTTTAHAIIGLSGKGWILKIFDASNIAPAPILTPTPTVTPSDTPIPTPTDSSSSSTSATLTPTPTVTPVPTSTPTPTATPTVLAQADNSSSNNVQPTSGTQVSPTPEATVLGAKAPIVLSANANKNTNNPIFVILFTGFGLFFTFTYFIRMFIMGERK